MVLKNTFAPLHRPHFSTSHRQLFWMLAEILIGDKYNGKQETFCTFKGVTRECTEYLMTIISSSVVYRV